jgi:hypothetical protein
MSEVRTSVACVASRGGDAERRQAVPRSGRRAIGRVGAPVDGSTVGVGGEASSLVSWLVVVAEVLLPPDECSLSDGADSSARRACFQVRSDGYFHPVEAAV